MDFIQNLFGLNAAFDWTTPKRVLSIELGLELRFKLC